DVEHVLGLVASVRESSTETRPPLDQDDLDPRLRGEQARRHEGAGEPASDHGVALRPRRRRVPRADRERLRRRASAAAAARSPGLGWRFEHRKEPNPAYGLVAIAVVFPPGRQPGGKTTAIATSPCRRPAPWVRSLALV